MTQSRTVDPTFKNSFIKVSNFLDSEIYRNRRIGTYNRESILLNREVPPVDTKDKEYRMLQGSLKPGLSTCSGCAAPVVFNLVAKAAQMRKLFLKQELLKEG